MIEVTVHREYKINADYYEHGIVGNWQKVTVSADTDMLALGEQLQEELDALQVAELQRLQDVITSKDPKDKRSMVHRILE